MEGREAVSLMGPGSGEARIREVTLAFCDIAGFTRFTERLGDLASFRIVRRCEALVESASRELGGELLEVRGDGFLFAFDSALAAACCAVAIQRELTVASDLPLRMRVGMHTGMAIHDGCRYFGRTVIAAFRVSSLAQPDEILVSDETRRRLPAAVFPVGRCRSVRLKGLARRHRVWGLDWRAARVANRSRLLGSGPTLRASHTEAAELAEAGAAGH
jgi:class 3 adenylate cyclase